MLFPKKKTALPSRTEALPGRDTSMQISPLHFVTKNTITPPFPEHLQQALFGLGCFWGAERKFWQQQGVFSTAVGFAAGLTPNPSYKEVCTGLTFHNEVVMIIFDPDIISYQQLLVIFWESHNPTQGMRQGNDQGTQYRSGIYTFDDIQHQQAIESKSHYQAKLSTAGLASITTEIIKAPTFYYAEDYHQQYLAKNPQGYCSLGGVDVAF